MTTSHAFVSSNSHAGRGQQVAHHGPAAGADLTVADALLSIEGDLMGDQFGGVLGRCRMWMGTASRRS